VVPLKRFTRIASGSLVADAILATICEPDRVVAYSSLSHDPSSPFSYRYTGKAALPVDLSVEKLLALRLDLFVFNGVSQEAKLEQLRRAGITVFDLGEMRGLSTVLPNIRSLGELIGEPERAERYATSFERRMQAIAAHIPIDQRPDAMYVGLHGDKLFGGGRGTSYDDVLTYAGLNNAAARRFEGWPRFTPEQMLLIDPEVIVTQTGMARQLCNTYGLQQLQACGEGGRVVELPSAMLVDPGIVMLDATEALHHAVFGDDRPRPLPPLRAARDEQP
jgi:iron complex transport system substrate-binding protein